MGYSSQTLILYSFASSSRRSTRARKHSPRRTRHEPAPRVLRWRSLRNHRAATCSSRRCLRSRLALATLHFVPARQSRRGYAACVVRSIARSSLFGGTLADIFTSAPGPSPTSLRSLAGSQCTTVASSGYYYSVFAEDGRATRIVVYTLCQIIGSYTKQIPAPPRLVRSAQDVETLRA